MTSRAPPAPPSPAVYTVGESRGWWDPIHNFLRPYVDKFVPSWMTGARGGVYGSGYKPAGAAAPAAAPISASAYGST